MNDNDFSEVLANFINTLGLPLKCKLDYLSEDEAFQSIPCPVAKWKTKTWLAPRFYRYRMR